ncbi:MAG: hypothetical protein JSW40_09485 [Candidatus Omnitrophota bacterium]|nr:MAG: hypothetical protein JSW40_09485 [Candidatus Omnitrophota bacterium]
MEENYTEKDKKIILLYRSLLVGVILFLISAPFLIKMDIARAIRLYFLLPFAIIFLFVWSWKAAVVINRTRENKFFAKLFRFMNKEECLKSFRLAKKVWIITMIALVALHLILRMFGYS